MGNGPSGMRETEGVTYRRQTKKQLAEDVEAATAEAERAREETAASERERQELEEKERREQEEQERRERAERRLEDIPEMERIVEEDLAALSKLDDVDHESLPGLYEEEINAVTVHWREWRAKVDRQIKDLDPAKQTSAERIETIYLILTDIKDEVSRKLTDTLVTVLGNQRKRLVRVAENPVATPFKENVNETIERIDNSMANLASDDARPIDGYNTFLATRRAEYDYDQKLKQA